MTSSLRKALVPVTLDHLSWISVAWIRLPQVPWVLHRLVCHSPPPHSPWHLRQDARWLRPTRRLLISLFPLWSRLTPWLRSQPAFLSLLSFPLPGMDFRLLPLISPPLLDGTAHSRIRACFRRSVPCCRILRFPSRVRPSSLPPLPHIHRAQTPRERICPMEPGLAVQWNQNQKDGKNPTKVMTWSRIDVVFVNETKGRYRWLICSCFRYLSASSSNTQMHPDSTSPVPSSPLISPRRSWSHAWPTPKWLCFVSGTMIKFLIPTLDTPWQQVEELALKDLMAKDCRNPFQYAPNGLTIVKVRDAKKKRTLDLVRTAHH